MAESFLEVKPQSLAIRPPTLVQPQVVHFRPLNGGLSTFESSQNIDKTKQAMMLNVAFVQDDLRKASGSIELWALGDPITSISSYESPTGGDTASLIITDKKLYKYVWGLGLVMVESFPSADLTYTGFQRWATMTFDDKFYFVNPSNSIREWPGAGAHTAIPSGFPARGMMALNNHIILVGTYLSGILEPKTIRWSSNYAGVVDFTGVGSGARDLADSSGNIQNCAAMSPLVGYVFKTDSMVEIRATGNVDNPFETVERAHVGLMLPYTLADYQGSLLFVGNDEQIYLFNGSTFDPIGNDIKRDFFNFHTRNMAPDYATAVFNPEDREYIIALPTNDGTNAIPTYKCWAYDIDRKRWRYFEWPGLTCMNHVVYRPGALHPRNPQFTMGTSTGKFLIASPDSTAFDGHELLFTFATGDFIGDGFGAEMTLVEVTIGYRIYGDGPFNLDVAVIRDEGQTFSQIVSKTLKGVPEVPMGSTLYQSYYFDVTGSQFRIQVGNTQSGKICHIHSIDAYLVPMKSERPGQIK